MVRTAAEADVEVPSAVRGRPLARRVRASARTPVTAAATAVAVALAVTLITGCGHFLAKRPSAFTTTSTVPTSTTMIANAGVLGNQRRPDESCAPDPTWPDPGPPTRLVRHAAGETVVPADAMRIVVLSGDQVDTLCALGLQSRIVGAALRDDGSLSQPLYLGKLVRDLPDVGTRTDLDLDKIRAAEPDLILGSEGLTPDAYADLSAIAPTVFTEAPGPAWKDNARIVGAATARVAAVDNVLKKFDEEAKQTGITKDAAHFQASVVQLTDDRLRVYGVNNFPGSVLADVGADRPESQRFTDQPYIEIDTSDLSDVDFSPADGDIVYMSFESPAAKERAPAILESDAWRRLSANRDNRVFVVNNEVWQSGEGPVAASGIVADLNWINAPIN